VDLQGLVKSGMMASLAGRPVTGIDPASAREPASARFYARKIRLVDHPHAVEKLRHLLADAVGYEVPAGRGRAGIAVPDAPLLVPAEYGLVVPSTSWPSKLWREDCWRRLIIELDGEGRKLILPWGSEQEEERARHLTAGIAGAEALSRRLNGVELMRLVGGARFAIGVDTGLMQLAAAFGVPGLTLFGPTDPARTAPYGENQRIVRSTGPFAPCLQEECTHGPGNERCMDGVTYEAVRGVAREMLAGGPAQAASA
jgi:heptosyltransferase-1